MNGQNSNLNNGTNNGLNSETLGSTTLGMAQNTPSMKGQNVNQTPVSNFGVNSMPNPTPVSNSGINSVPNPTPVPNSGINSMPNPSPVPNPGVNSVPNPTPVPNSGINSVPNPTPVPSEPIPRPIPGTETLTGSTVGVNNNFTPTGNINGFTNSNKVENIGAMPPQNNDNKKKKPMNKILFIILIVVLIGAVAYGVYYFLSVSKNTVKLTPKTVSIGVGETVPDDIKEYATITRGNSSTCSVNTRNVDTSSIGEYEVTITCGKNTYKSKVVVSDKTAPVAELNMVFKTVNATVSVEDFIKSCNDPSNCKTSFADEAKVNEYMATAGGPYEVAIEAVDDAGNNASYTATLYVTSEDIFLFANFSSAEEILTEYKAKKVVNDIFAINRTLVFLNAARRDYKYTFENAADYNEIVKNKENTITFDGITGIATYDDNNLSLVISTDLSLDTLKSENNGNFPTSYQEIQTIYKDTKGYTPSFIRSYPQAESEE